jgi:nicotinamide riboside kinase
VATWHRSAKIAFVGSHGIRKTTAAHAFANTVQRAGRSVEFGREVVRDNPLGINEAATGEAQLWVLVSQIRQELELAPKAEVLVTDRGAVDNYAYYFRACGLADRFSVEPLVRAWARTYDLVVRLTPDIALRADGIRSTSDAFRDEIEALLDRFLPGFVAQDRLLTVPASQITDDFDWWPVAHHLAAIVGEPLLAEGIRVPRRRRRAAPDAAGRAAARDREGSPQLALDLDGTGAAGRPETSAPERAS